MRINWCRWLGHKLTVDLGTQAVNMRGCARCGQLFKVDLRQPCSYSTSQRTEPVCKEEKE